MRSFSLKEELHAVLSMTLCFLVGLQVYAVYSYLVANGLLQQYFVPPAYELVPIVGQVYIALVVNITLFLLVHESRE